MQQSYLESTSRSRQLMSSFGGLNQNEYCPPNEFRSMMNLSSDAYPYLTQRELRKFSTESYYLAEKEKPQSVIFEYRVSSEDLWDFRTYEPFNFEMGRLYKIEVTLYDNVKDIGNIGLFVTDGVAAWGHVEQCTYIDGNYYIRGGDCPYFAFNMEIAESENDFPFKSFIITPLVAGVEAACIYNGKIALISNNSLYIDGECVAYYITTPKDLFVEKSLIVYGAYLICFPSGYVYNTETKTGEYIEISKTVYGGYRPYDPYATKLKYINCDENGAELEILFSSTSPDTPQNGQLWYDTENKGLYRWSEASGVWSGVSTQYVRLSIHYEMPIASTQEDADEFNATNAFDSFHVGDAVLIDGEKPDLFADDTYAVIKKIGKGLEKGANADGEELDIKFDYMLFSGVVEPCEYKSFNSITISRNLPILSHVISCNNRLWGCAYQTTAEGDGRYNEIRCCKLGDPLNWNVFEGISTDSYVMNIGDAGDFTGAIEYDGYPLFFKENTIYKIYGDYPANYQLRRISCAGVEKNSGKSLVVTGGLLYYKAANDFCILNSELQQSISYNLKERYSNVVSGAVNGKIYNSCYDSNGHTVLLIYDGVVGMWYKENCEKIQQFCSDNAGRMFGVCENEIVEFGTNGIVTGEKETSIEWFAETGLIGLDFPDQKAVSKYTIRVKMEIGAELTLKAEYDDGGFETLFTLVGDGRLISHTYSAKPVRCDHLRLRFEGKGKSTIYSLAYTMEQRSENT